VLAGFIAVRYRLRLVSGLASRWITLRRSRYGAGERVLVVGAGAGSEFATWLLRRPDFRGLYNIIGIADDAPSKQGMRYDGVRVLGTVADIPEMVKRHDIGVIFQAISNVSAADSERILAACRRTGLHTVMLADLLRTLHLQLTKSLPGCGQACPYLVGSGIDMSS
jgi:FlaA1/EpsC-like NDP-sugar epimerase